MPLVFSLPRPRSLLLVLCLLIHTANVILTNLTIDDTNTTYFTWPEGPTQRSPVWANASTANPCSQVFIYGIDLANSANISFLLDDVTTYHQYPRPSQFVFKALFFEAKDLALGENHTVSWLLSKSSTNGTSALFYYAVVTMDTTGISPSSPTGTLNPSSSAWVPCISQSSHLMRFVPAADTRKLDQSSAGYLGGLALLCLTEFGLFWWRRRSKKTPILAGAGNPSSMPMGAVEPFIPRTGDQLGGQRSKTLNVAWNNVADSTPTNANNRVDGNDEDGGTLPPPYPASASPH
ncbi:hypothetical protein DFH09DRAFT_1075996 [Mycena vulgaris]|nr:hypothetical protein DFH09DRAFT_1075996 [Mycena vulgaris]